MEKKMNNKGFSMVELIIVIAIMAVLVVVAAPQYLKYVERGRNSTDRNNATAIESALLVWASDTEADKPFVAGTGTVTVDNDSMDVGGDAALKDPIEAALANANISGLTCQSKTKWTSYEVKIVVDSNGKVTVSNNIP